MKLQIDTTAKTIKLDEAVKLEELISALDKLFPDGLWKEFQLITNVTINWQTNPIIIKEYPIWPTYPTYPTQPYPWVIYDAGYKLTSGTYDVQL